VGNAVNVVTELVLTSAVLVRNSIGVAALLALTLAGLSPVIHYGMLSFAYRFLAAVAQPVSDKRMVGCLSTMGEGCAMLLRILLTMELLCILTLVILMVSFGSSS
jgi:stage III sporulation protein AE